MYTGIVQGIATVESIRQSQEIVTLSVEFPSGALVDIKQGASVSINGCCLTVTRFTDRLASFDCVPETLARTNLGALVVGSLVNFERSARMGDEIGGHVLSGHIDCVAEVIRVEPHDWSKEVTFRVAPTWTKYLFAKGSIAIEGASLTLVRVDKQSGEFSVAFIPETLAKTTFGTIEPGRRVNIEIDRTAQIVVETIERVMSERSA